MYEYPISPTRRRTVNERLLFVVTRLLTVANRSLARSLVQRPQPAHGSSQRRAITRGTVHEHAQSNHTTEPTEQSLTTHLTHSGSSRRRSSQLVETKININGARLVQAGFNGTLKPFCAFKAWQFCLKSWNYTVKVYKILHFAEYNNRHRNYHRSTAFYYYSFEVCKV